MAPVGVFAETILGAMAKAYENNPDLDAARAALRATDEDVAIAGSQYRPRITASADVSAKRTDAGASSVPANAVDSSVGVTFTQSLFDGFQTQNKVRAAKAEVSGGRQDLIGTQMTILFSAARIYADVVRDARIVRVRRKNLEFVREQRNAAQARFDVGEGTRTDIALAQARLEAARASLLSAKAQHASSVAAYVRIIGVAPKDLQTPLQTPVPARTAIPASSKAAVAVGLREHPDIVSAGHGAEAAAFRVKAAEGATLPGVSLSGSVSHGDDARTSASVSARLSVPIYQGGAAATLRQLKETQGQARILVDAARRKVRQAIVSDWTQLQASRASIAANAAQVQAARLALQGVMEENTVGQSSTLDVLEARSDVLSAQERLARSRRDAVVASYSLLRSMGRLTAARLGLKVNAYRPERHHDAVKDRWFGLRAPDGR